jgi:eukaryotic-like serine/threonine-protein kinase
VGREKERATIAAALDRAMNGWGSLILLAGGPGVGKTRLAIEMAEDASGLGFGSRVGRCYESKDSVPHLPFVEIIEGALASAESLEQFREQIADNAPELAQLAPWLRRIYPEIPPALELAPAHRRRQLFQSFSEFVARAAAGRPQFYILEDLHWADESTLALLIHLANQVIRLPLVIIGTYRDEFSESNPALAATLEQLIRLGIRPLKLRGLSKDAVARILQGLGRHQAPESLVTVIFDESQGNPFFVEEVYRHLLDNGKLFDAAGDFRIDIKIDEIDVPDNVRLVISRRLERMGETEKRILAAAAIIGRSFGFQLLSAVCQTEFDELFGAIETAQRMGIIIPSSEGPEKPFTFAHELMRQTLLVGVSVPRQQRLHANVAQAIEQLSANAVSERAGDIADHLLRAGPFADRDKLVLCLTQTGKAALDAGAYEQARFSLSSAMSHMDGADPRARADLLSNLAIAQRSLGDWDGALRTCNEAVEVYRQLGNVEMTTEWIREGIAVLLMTRRYQEAAEMARRRLAELGDEPTESRADFLALVGLSYAMLGSYVPAKDALSEATALARRLSNPKLLVRVLADLCMMNTIFLELADSLINTQTTLDLAQSDDFLWVRAGALYGQSQAFYCLGRLEEAGRITAELEPLARKIGQLVLVAACIWRRAWAEFAKNPDLRRLEAGLNESVEICKTARIPENLAQSLAQLSLVKFLRGQQSSALDCALEAAKLELEGPGYVQGFAVGTVFRERAYAGDHAGAMAVFNENLSKLPRADQPNTFGSWAFLVSAVEGLAMLGERDRAADFYPLVCRLVDTGMISLPVMARFSRTVAGVAATAARQWQSAEEHFSIALRQAEEMPDQLERAECRRFYGSMLLDRNSAGDREQARRLLSDALEDYTRIGMPLHIKLTEALRAKV